MKPYERTGLGRPIDIRYPSNRLAVIGTVVAGAVALVVVWARDGNLDVFAAASFAIAVFIAWALGRELDPDHPSSAAVAMVVAAGLGFVAPAAALLSGVALLALRILVGTVGVKLWPVDLVVLAGAGLYALSRPEGWPVAVLLAVAVAVALPARGRWIVGALTVGVMVLGVALGWAPGLQALDGEALALSALAAVAAVLSVPVSAVESKTDHHDRSIAPSRVAAARIAAAGVVGAAGLMGAGGAAALSPLVAALVGVAVVRRLRRRPVEDEAGPKTLAGV